MDKNQPGIRVVRLAESPKARIPSEEEAEARLHGEGYESFRWYDVQGACYPKHRHQVDECIWILKGEITFQIGKDEYPLQAGDRIYIPAMTAHTASVPANAGVTYLVGQKAK